MPFLLEPLVSGFPLVTPSPCSMVKSRSDPLLILTQIVTLQLGFYSTLMLISLVVSSRVEMSIFDTHNYDFSHTGYVKSASLLIHSLLMSLLVVKVVEYSKMCVDFCCTMYGVHLLCCMIVNRSIPLSYLSVIIILLTVNILLSEFLCRKQETKPLGSKPESLLKRVLLYMRTRLVGRKRFEPVPVLPLR